MRTLVMAMATISFAVLGVASPASAFEGGGRKPSEAPLIAVGQHYTGQLNNHGTDANYAGYREVALWRLPPLATRDAVTVDWHTVPFTRHGYSGFPICLVLAQGVDDFSWGSVFGNTTEERGCDEGGPVYSLSGSGSAQTTITVQETNATSSYLEFLSFAQEVSPSSLETYPYDFTVEPVRHYLGVTIRPTAHIRSNGILRATASLANGSPAPAGLTYTLAVTWSGGGSANYSAVSSVGAVSFPLALPETADGKAATFVVSHPADAQYQAARSTKFVVRVIKATAPPPSPCLLAERHVHSLATQYKRLVRRARLAQGATRRRLRRRAAQVRRALRAERLHAESVCGTG